MNEKHFLDRRYFKIKKNILIAAVIALILVLSPSWVLAGPPDSPDLGITDPAGLWPTYPPGVVKVLPAPWAADGQLHIVNDPMAPTADGNTDSAGWIIFWCDSLIGFQYHIGASGLDPLSDFTVVANFPGPAADPVLGTLHTDVNGLGTIQGILQLEPGSYFLWIDVINSNDINVLSSGPGGSNDGQGFGVY